MLRAPISLAGSTRRGMVTAQVVLSLSALMAMLAVVADGGLLLAERRHAQATADAAALAAASDLYAKWNTNHGLDPSGTAKNSAWGVASANGYTNDGKTSHVTVGPPLSGNFVGKAGYAEVIVTWYQKRSFSGVLGTGTIPVSARAVAQGAPLVGGPGSPPAILLLGNTGTTVRGTGNASLSLTVPNGYTGSAGSIYIDSAGPNAVSLSGNHASVTAPFVYTAQTTALPSGVTATSGSHTPTLGAAPLPDPLSYLPAPSSSSPPPGISVVSLPGGISGSMTLTSNTIYIVGSNGIDLSGNATVTGTNVMIYLTGANASITLTGNGSLSLTPMNTGPYSGLSIFQDRSDSSSWDLHGNGGMNVTGTIYAPAASITATGNGNAIGSQLVANNITLKGNGNGVAFNPTPGQIAAPRSTFGLVE